jgi:hypothetical protein
LTGVLLGSNGGSGNDVRIAKVEVVDLEDGGGSAGG